MRLWCCSGCLGPARSGSWGPRVVEALEERLVSGGQLEAHSSLTVYEHSWSFVHSCMSMRCPRDFRRSVGG